MRPALAYAQRTHIRRRTLWLTRSEITCEKEKDSTLRDQETRRRRQSEKRKEERDRAQKRKRRLD